MKALIRFIKKNEIWIGALILFGYLCWALAWFLYQHFIAGSPSVPYFPIVSLKTELVAPLSKNYILGTDIYGRSLFELISLGLLYSLTVSITVALSSVSIGTIFGYLIVRLPKKISYLLELFTNLIFIFPGILIAILIMASTGQSTAGLYFALIATGWPGYAKIVKGETLRVVNLSFVEGARAIGIGEFRLFFRHIFPSIFPVIIVHLVLGISGVIVSEAALGFLGLGGSEYSLGVLLSMGKTVLLESPHIVLILSLIMSGLIIGLNLLGDGLRDLLDPYGP